ncbi:MAG: hypothetical protein GWM92_15735 [Gemmatimonadetes bacterium]|nr:hypothetical protein [Gemmatimonadota bacterium]NIR80183.1 hypothetical protein [Gemmatimonadota bacterium]NIT88945.1 hypothetical protein [Gemmatimonadota bacterium]NIU32740.1 hypothetical protein [Gemmatimonadota bacterium]NIU37172.1 hypothetical protein [Gemmatimonadota bacterium]
MIAILGISTGALVGTLTDLAGDALSGDDETFFDAAALPEDELADAFRALPDKARPVADYIWAERLTGDAGAGPVSSRSELDNPDRLAEVAVALTGGSGDNLLSAKENEVLRLSRVALDAYADLVNTSSDPWGGDATTAWDPSTTLTTSDGVAGASVAGVPVWAWALGGGLLLVLVILLQAEG